MKAWELIADPARFTKEFFAKNANGEVVDATDDSAVCFCTAGALHKVYPGDAQTDNYKLRAEIAREYKRLHKPKDVDEWDWTIYDFNDAPEMTAEKASACLREAEEAVLARRAAAATTAA